LSKIHIQDHYNIIPYEEIKIDKLLILIISFRNVHMYNCFQKMRIGIYVCCKLFMLEVMMKKSRYWTLEEITTKLGKIKDKGYLSVKTKMYRQDEGIVGQILEREFGITENNLHVGDLGNFELKGMRKKSSTLTLGHLKPYFGLNPIQIFDKYGYIRPSKRDISIIKKKLFTTVKGTKVNERGLLLKAHGTSEINMFDGADLICRWNLAESLAKFNNIILVFAETIGKTGAKDEQFHYFQAYLLKDIRPINELVNEGKIVIDFCIDQKLGDTVGPHDRGPHIRIPKSKLFEAFNEVKQIL
jgi:hypothetical protein